jgi:peptidoglycan/LPS O-acetylase OafA/YrhL
MWREQLTSGKRIFFWGIVPVGAVLLGLMTLSFSDWTLKRAILIAWVDLTFLCFAIGLYNPQRLRWAMGLAMASVFLSYCAYVLDQFFLNRSKDWPRGHGAVSPLNALLGLLYIGLPALSGAIVCFRRRKAPARQNEFEPVNGPDPIHPE